MTTSVDMLNTMIMCMFIQPVGTALPELTKAIVKLIKFYVAKLYKKIVPPMNELTVSFSYIFMHNGNRIWVDADYQDESIIKSLTQFISENNLCKGSAKIAVEVVNGSNVTGLIPLPGEIIEYDGYYMTFDSTMEEGPGGNNASDARAKLTQKMTISSKRSLPEIKNWVMSVLEKWESSRNKKFETKGYVFRHIRGDIDDTHPTFDRYPSKSTVTFNDLHFEEKDDIMKIVRKFKSGEMKKATLLLHGKPGHGKTSTILAIANELDAIIVDVKLSYITNDTQLQRAFNSETMSYTDHNMNNRRTTVPFKKRLYVLEEIDAESDVVKQRSKEGSDPINSSDGAITRNIPDDEKKALKKDKKMKKLNKLFAKYGSGGVSLAGVLDALDGIVRLNSMIVITTNRIKYLDEALVRPGRMDAVIELKTLRSIDASAMIKRKFPDSEITLEDGAISPAMLESFISISDDSAELAGRVKKYLASV